MESLAEQEACGHDRLSRAETTLLALRRLDLLGKESLTIHVAGAEAKREGGLGEGTYAIFCKLLEAVSDAGTAYIRMALVGPTARGDLVRDSEASTEFKTCIGLASIEIRHEPGFYHEVVFPDGPWNCPDLVIAFQPGIWGYATWEPSVRCRLDASPFVFTSYNAEEAELDFDSLQDMAFSAEHWARPGWAPEQNPCAAATARACKIHQGIFLTEQHWWQCLVPLHDSGST